MLRRTTTTGRLSTLASSCKPPESDTISPPDRYRGALFFADSIRGCIWSMPLDEQGEPDPSRTEPFLSDLSMPVKLYTGPEGDLLYLSFTGANGGSLHRVPYRAPAATALSDASDTATSTHPPGPRGLVAEYGFNEGDGEVAVDSGGHRNHGELSGPLRVSGGRYGDGLWFDGVDDWVEVPASRSLAAPWFTVELWTLPSSFRDRWQIGALRGSQRDIEYGLYPSTPDKGPGAVATPRRHRNELTTDEFISVDEWTHLALTYDGRALRLYVNGTQVREQEARGAVWPSDPALWFGGTPAGEDLLHGILDEIGVYNRALSPAEIAKDMERPVD
ncbi:concanavalin A-like lectin/glucanase superfamily protein [Amycolatopsis cihanbeyliensis]|uniref:Concanavalin A-like lectin/glucanase superfamily protein n=1 Tax=Amycolatopsis cihanbeyliensis TaxID=1128664 RepID=A0A542CS80_AMYCI|nr:concanavalin A-like lectin/glucanase superfamily protein [Amycolatopsis cihanbeyliensis]